MQCLILAGGLGTRMKPETDQFPKALLPVCGMPFEFHQLSWLAQYGVTEVVYSIGYKGQMIQNYVGTGEQWGLSVKYVDEGTELKGTGGAVRFAHDQGVLNSEFLLTYGDSFLPIDFSEVWKHFQAEQRPALMTVLKNEGAWDASNVIFEDQKIVLYDKTLGNAKPVNMSYIDYGLLAFRRDLIDSAIPRGAKLDLSTFLNRLSVQSELAGYEVKSRFYEIGSPAGLRDLELFIEQQRHWA